MIAILDAAALSAGDHVLDVGCGCGATTLAAARTITSCWRGRVIIVDVSPAG